MKSLNDTITQATELGYEVRFLNPAGISAALCIQLIDIGGQRIMTHYISQVDLDHAIIDLLQAHLMSMMRDFDAHAERIYWP